MTHLDYIQASTSTSGSRCSHLQRESILFHSALKIGVLGLFILLVNAIPGLGQTVDSDSTASFWRNLWEAKAAQLQMLFAINPEHDTILDSLFLESVSALQAGKFQEAYELLEITAELIDTAATSPGNWPNLENTPQVANQPTSSSNLFKTFPFQLEVGFDQSSYTTTSPGDALSALDGYQLNTPFTAFQWNQNFGTDANRFTLQHRLRLDSQYLNYYFRNYFQQSAPNHLFRLDVGGDYFQNLQDSTNRYIDVNVEATWNRYNWTKWQMFLRGYWRIKRYFVDNSGFPQINQWGGEWSNEWIIGLYRRLGITLRGERYREFQPEWNSYQNVTLETFFRIARDLNRNLAVSARLEQREFTTRLDSVTYSNRFFENVNDVSGEFPLVFNMSLGGTAEFRYRKVKTPDEFTPDERRVSLEVFSKVYFGSQNYVGVGVWLEQDQYTAPQTEANAYVKSFNRTVYGATVYLNYFDAKGRMITLEGRYGKSRYPSAEANPFPSLYSDSRLYAINLVGWLPLSPHIHMQMLANYSTETSLVYENTTAKGRTVSISLIYQW